MCLRRSPWPLLDISSLPVLLPSIPQKRIHHFSLTESQTDFWLGASSSAWPLNHLKLTRNQSAGLTKAGLPSLKAHLPPASNGLPPHSPSIKLLQPETRQLHREIANQNRSGQTEFLNLIITFCGSSSPHSSCGMC